MIGSRLIDSDGNELRDDAIDLGQDRRQTDRQGSQSITNRWIPIGAVEQSHLIPGQIVEHVM